MSDLLTRGLKQANSASSLLRLGLGGGGASPLVNPLVVNISPADGTIAALGANSRFSVRDALTEINLSKLQFYLGTGPVFYRGGTLPEELVGPPTFYFEAQSGSPGVYADREILPDDFLRISKSIPSQNQEAVYFMGGLEAPAEPDAPLMLEFSLRMDKLVVTTDPSGFTGVLIGMLIGDGGLAVKFYVQSGAPRIEIHDAGLATSSPPNLSYKNYFNWDVLSAYNADGSNTYKLLWYPQRGLVRFYVKETSSVSDRLLISGTTADFPSVPPSERRPNQPWAFFGHGAYPIPTSVSEWKNVYLYNIVTNPIRDGIITGGHITVLSTNNPVYYDGESLPGDTHCAWPSLPAAFGAQGGAVRVTSNGLALDRMSATESLGFYRVEPKVRRKTVLDLRLSGRVLFQEPGIETTGMEFYVDDGTRQARVALLQDASGTQYVGILRDKNNPGSLVSYAASIQSFGVERDYRLVFMPWSKAELIMLVATDEGVKEQLVLSVNYSDLPSTGMPGPGIGFLHNANSGAATAQMLVRQVRYTARTEIADFTDFSTGAWTKLGSGTYSLITPPGESAPAYGRLTDASGIDNTYFRKVYPGTELQADSGWSLEFRSRVVSYEHDPALTSYQASGVNPIRASTGFQVRVLNSSNQATLVFAEVGPPSGRIVFLATCKDASDFSHYSVYNNFMAIRAKEAYVTGTYYAVDWTKFHLYRLERTVGGLLRLFIDEGPAPVLSFQERDVYYPPQWGGGSPRVEIGHLPNDSETGIKTVSDFQLIKFSASDGFDISCRPALTSQELLERFSCATNVLVETSDV
jgi:hypothetical protein